MRGTSCYLPDSLSDLTATGAPPSPPTPPIPKHTRTHTRSAYTSNCVGSLTCGGTDGADEDGGHSHDEAAEGGQEGQDLGVGSGGGRQHSLEIHLPGDSSKHLQHIQRRVNDRHIQTRIQVGFTHGAQNQDIVWKRFTKDPTKTPSNRERK